jgi:hypothetical protein
VGGVSDADLRCPEWAKDRSPGQAIASLASYCAALGSHPHPSSAEQKRPRSVGVFSRPKWNPDSSTTAIHPDGTFRDDFNLHRNYWEAKNSGDNSDIDIREKIVTV